MWPFERKPIVTRLGAVPVGEAAAVVVLTSVVSSNVVTSPVSGISSALLQVELLERVPIGQGRTEAFGAEGSLHDDFVSLGRATFGQVLVLRDQGGDEISLVVGRARFDVTTPRNGGTPIASVPAELVPFLRNASGRGVVCYREFPLLQGDKVLLRAVVEPSQAVVTGGYRSGSSLRYVARDDLGPVVLEEVIEAPAW